MNQRASMWAVTTGDRDPDSSPSGGRILRTVPHVTMAHSRLATALKQHAGPSHMTLRQLCRHSTKQQAFPPEDRE